MTARVPRRPGRPAGGRPVVDRAGILVAAERAIRRLGPGASIDDIAATAGVTKPVVYARVGDRAELARALAERLVDRVVRAVGAAVPPGSDGRDSMRTFLHTHLATVAADRDIYAYVTAGAEPTEGVLHLAARSVAPLAAGIAEWRVAHGGDPDVATPWAYAIVGALHLTVLWWLHSGDRTSDELADQLTALLWDGLGR